MSDLLYFTKSLKLRAEAADALQRARQLPRGPDRNALRQIARSLRALAATEAWLDGNLAPPDHVSGATGQATSSGARGD
jgi:hypothetical protein